MPDISSTQSSPRPIAVFDFDGTLTRRDSLPAFLRHLVGPWAFVGLTLRCLPVLLQYALGRMPNDQAKAAVFRAFLGGRPVEIVEAKARAFARDRIPDLLRPEAMQRLAWHRAQGHRLVLVSASVGLYLRPWAKAVGMDDVLCTDLHTRDGVFTGQLDGANCYGPEKLRRLRTALPESATVPTWAYGDSRGDRELLQAASHAYYRSFSTPTPPPAASTPSPTADAVLSPRAMRLLAVTVVGSLALYAGLMVWSGAEASLRALQAMTPGTVSLVLGTVLAGYGMRFVRWHRYLRFLGHPVPWRHNLRVFLTSFALTATPAKAGESVKSLLLKQSCGIPAPATLSALFAERFTDVLSVVLVVAAGLATLAHGTWVVLGVGVAQIGTLALLARPRWLHRTVVLPLARTHRIRRWMHPVADLLTGAQQLLRPTRLGSGLLLGMGPWIGEGIAMWLLFQALGCDAIALHEAILIHAAATLFGALTFLPGGLGGHEAVSIALSIAYGASAPEAAAATVLIRLFTLWFAVALGGAVALTSLPIRTRTWRTSVS